VLWPKERPEEDFDPDNEEHMRWMFDHAAARAQEFGIRGVTYQLTQGVVKNIIPAIASTNALVAAVCSMETLKLVTMCSTGLNNYMMYVGTDSVYALTSSYERDPSCPVCSPGVTFEVNPEASLGEVVDAIVKDEHLGKHVSAPSVSYGTNNLYMRGVLEEATRENLTRAICSLVDGSGSVITLNDKLLVGPMRVKLKFTTVGRDEAIISNGEMES